jgi:hypothetical protein
MSPLRRLLLPALVVGVPIAVLLPAVTGDDSFPLSTYPMYAFTRPRVETFVAVLAEHVDGQRDPVSSSTTAGTTDPLIAESVVSQAIARDGGAELCRAVAARLGGNAVAVLVVEQTHDVLAWAEHKPSLRDEIVHQRCEVPR